MVSRSIPADGAARRHKKTLSEASSRTQRAKSAPAHRGGFTDLCTWEWDLRTNHFWLSDQFRKLLGVGSATEVSSAEDFVKFVHADERNLAMQTIQAVASGTPFEREIRLLSHTEEVLPTHSRGIPICDRNGTVVSVLGFCRLASDPFSDQPARHSAVLLAQAEQVANFGSWQFDIKARSGSVSRHLAHLMGIEPATTLSEAAYWQRIHPDDRAQVMEIAGAAAANLKPFQFVARYFLPNGALRHHFVRGLPVLGADGTLDAFVGITLDFSDQTHADGELHRLSQKLMRARDDERRNIARELHESTGQTLAALKMSLGRLREALAEDDETAHNLLSSAVDLADEAVREVRTLSYLMHPPMLDEAGLSSALRWYAKGFSERSGIPVQVDVPEDFGRHGQEIETTVFRIVQEALTNVHRYSGSRTATIRLVRKIDSISAEVRDDGCGLPTPNAKSGWSVPLGVGILGMRERVKQLDGSFEMDSAPGRGTTVRVSLPVKPDAGKVRPQEGGTER
jgi:signal transduction histidine kinase